ncbi:MAG: glycoside hydrolase family 13 protein [Pseudonocardia sp.]
MTTSDPTDVESRAAPWWRTAVVYQIYPRSFADSDGDGVGDLPGITARLAYVADLGVDAVWLSPFYVSPMADAGYDVADHRDVDPLFGTLADADRLIAEAHRLGLRVIVDLVPNHTSDAHPWFRAALAAGPGSSERARYLFREGAGPDGARPPNGWQSVFGGAAWNRVTEPDGRAGQWYLAMFDSRQPDLDWSNPEVHAEFEDVLRWWLMRGVDGFRVDVAHGLVKADGLPEWDRPHELITAGSERAPMWDQDGVHEVYRAWRRVVDSYPGERMLVAEAWVAPPERLARYVRPDEMHQAFNFDFLLAGWSARRLRAAVDSSIEANAGVGAPPTWVLSNHDVVRHTSRLTLAPGERPDGIGPHDPQPDESLGLRRGRAATAIMLALPGGAYLYQGEELGLPEHTTLPDEVRQDPTWLRNGGTVAGRDGCRVPIPWEAGVPTFGFSTGGRGWLPQPAGYARYAADIQRGDPASTLELYRRMLRLRRAFRLGESGLSWADGVCGGGGAGDDVLAFRLDGPGGPVLVVANLGPGPCRLPAEVGRVVLATADLGPSGGVPTDATVWVRPD